jgi:hypothetical protein
MNGGNNPYAGAVPLHLRQRGKEDEVSKSTSWRPGATHKIAVRNQHDDPTITPRNAGITYCRRYPNGKLDVQAVAHKVIDAIHKAKLGGYLTNDEKALITMIIPGRAMIDPRIAGTMFKMTDEERLLVAIVVQRHLSEELNWNAGRGGGSVPGRSSTLS